MLSTFGKPKRCFMASCQPTGQRLSGGVAPNGTEQLRESSISPFAQTLSAGLISPLDNTRTPGYDKKIGGNTMLILLA